MGQRIVIVGTGGMGREAAAWVAEASPQAELLGFLDADPARHGAQVAGASVLGDLGWLDDQEDVEVVAIGTPAARARLVDHLDAAGVRLASVVHPSARIGLRVTIEDGVIVCPGVLLTCDVRIGRAAIVNYGAMVGHDGEVGDAAFVAPGVHLAAT